MFALGGRSFTKRLATDLSMDLDEAERFKVAHSEGHLAAEQSAMARRASPRPPKSSPRASPSPSRSSPVPTRSGSICLAGGGAALPEVAEQLRILDWSDTVPFTRPPTVKVLGPSDVTGVYDTTASWSAARMSPRWGLRDTP